MKNIIPKKKSMTWFKLLPIMIVLMTILLNLFYSLGVKQGFSFKTIFMFLGISFVVSIAICDFGYYGFKYSFITSFIGNIVAIIFAALAFTKNLSGWQDLVGIISYIEIVGVGILLGIIIEVVMRIVHKRK